MERLLLCGLTGGRNKEGRMRMCRKGVQILKSCGRKRLFSGEDLFGGKLASLVWEVSFACVGGRFTGRMCCGAV